ncbi:hypothetical protein V6N13_033853 [Hibiscus sabdariffa]
MDVFQQSNGSEVKGAVQETCLEGTVVPNSLISKSMNSMEMVRMWKGNKVEDWRVIETTSWMAEEDIEIIHRDEELRCNAVNLSAKYDLREEIQAASGESAWFGLHKEVVTDSLVFKMRNLKTVLKEWNRESFGNVDEKNRLIVAEIKELVARLDNKELGSSEL